MGHGGYFLRFELAHVSWQRVELYADMARCVTRRYKEECERSAMADGSPQVDCAWAREQRVSHGIVYVAYESEITPELYGFERVGEGDSLFQRICRAIAEEASQPFCGRCAYQTDEGTLQAIEARFDATALSFAVLGAHESHLCEGCATKLAEADDPWLSKWERSGIAGSRLALLRPVFSCEEDGCSVEVSVQRWCADPDWTGGGSAPFVRVDVDEAVGFDWPLMQRAQRVDSFACGTVATRWILDRAADAQLVGRLADDPTLGNDPQLMTSYVWSDQDWTRIAREVPELRAVALVNMRGYPIILYRDEIVSYAREADAPAAYASVVRMLRLTEKDIPNDLLESLVAPFANREPTPAEWNVVLRMLEPDRTEVILALLDTDGGCDFTRATALIDAVMAGKHKALDLEALHAGVRTRHQRRNLNYFESYFRGVHCTWR